MRVLTFADSYDGVSVTEHGQHAIARFEEASGFIFEHRLEIDWPEFPEPDGRIKGLSQHEPNIAMLDAIPGMFEWASKALGACRHTATRQAKLNNAEGAFFANIAKVLKQIEYRLNEESEINRDDFSVFINKILELARTTLRYNAFWRNDEPIQFGEINRLIRDNMPNTN